MSIQVVHVARQRELHAEYETPPKFTIQPKVLIKPLGSQSELRCAATGSPEPSIEWAKNGVVMPGE